MHRFGTIALLSVTLTACQATNSILTANGAHDATPASIRAALPILPSMMTMSTERPSFSKPNEQQTKGPPSATWVFASNGEAGNVDVYDAASLAMISQCACTGVGLAVDPASGDLAVGTRSSTVTVWHVKNKQISLFSTLNLSAGPYAIGLTYDDKGDLYAGNVGDNVIDFFSASEISAGGGSPTRTLVTSNLNEVYYLAATGNRLLADGYDQNDQPLLVSVNTKTGGDTILQKTQLSGQLIGGIVLDLKDNLTINAIGNTNMLLAFPKPWTGSPTETFVYGSGAQNSYYSGISLNRSQRTLWAGNFVIQQVSHGFTNLQANSYPLGTVGRSTALVASEYYDSVAVDPQAKR